jgi:uncharacterized protein (TIGR00251 family)
VRNSTIRIAVKVRTGARKNGIIDYSDSVLRVKIATPPMRGKANKALIVYLSKILNVSKSAIAIEKGETSRNKLISIAGMDVVRLNTMIDYRLGSET